MNFLKINYFIIFTILLSFFSITYALGDTCNYTSQIEQCIKANKDGRVKTIEDFVCITSQNRDSISYQIILDEEFKIIDNKMDLYIENLEKNKNTYFGVGAKKNYIDGINDISDMSDSFKYKYLNLCTDTILNEAEVCSNKDQKKQKVSNENVIHYFNDGGTQCKKLVDIKIAIFNKVAFGILMLDKLQIKADEKKIYDQGQRTHYDHLLDIMMINIGYIERIWQKIPSLLANPM